MNSSKNGSGILSEGTNTNIDNYAASSRRVRFVNAPGHRTSCAALARAAVALVAHAT